MAQIPLTIPESLSLRHGDELDLRVSVRDGELIVLKVLRQIKSEGHAPDYRVKLGHWNRK